MCMRIVARSLRGVNLSSQRRIVVAQTLYALGALLCVFHTSWSIAFIVVAQLNYAIAPRIMRRRE